MCAAYYYTGSGSGSGGAGSDYYGNSMNTVVLDIGSYSTKMGWAGDDYPRSLFRSNVAVTRHPYDNHNNHNNNKEDDDNRTTNTATAADPNSSNPNDTTNITSNTNKSINRKHHVGGGRIKNDNLDSIKYDYYTRPIHYNTDDDGDYEPCNPVDINGTGLLYQSLNSNAINAYTNTTNDNDPDNIDINIIPDWYDMIQYYMNHTYETSSFMGNQSSDHPLLFIEKSYNTSAIRQKIIECLFEECNVPSTYIAKDAVLQCYGVGKTTSISIDIGYSGITVSPVYDGYIEKNTIQRNPLGIKALDESILQYMDRIYYQQQNRNKHRKQESSTSSNFYCMPLYQVRQKDKNKIRKESIHYYTRLELAQQCRESGSGAAILENNASGGDTTTTTGQPTSKTSSSSGTFHAPNTSFELPDGTILDIPSSDRFRSADILLGNHLLSIIPSLPTSLSNSITIQQYREIIYEQTKQQISSYCATTQKAYTTFQNYNNNQNNINNNNGGSANSNTDMMNDENQQQQKLLQQQLGAGIISRKQKEEFQASKRLKLSSSLSSKDNTGRTLESYMNWHRANSTDLQLLANEQLTSASLSNMICDAAYKCDRDQQGQLLSSIVLGGGGSCSFGPSENALPDLIKDNVETLIHTHTPGWRVRIYTPTISSERSILSWLGGSILGSLNTFQNMYITKAEYDEWGPAIVNRKCP